VNTKFVMTLFTIVLTWTLFRSVVLILLTLPFCGLVVRWISSSHGWQRVLQWCLLSVPFLFPELLTGYAYGQMTRLLITGPWIREFWFDLLLALRVVPIGTLLWYCSPPSPISREAIHLRTLSFRDSDSKARRFLILMWYQLQGPVRTSLFAGCGLFLVVFQEFELASLLAVRSWTVWLFDAQAEGSPLSESLRDVAIPAGISWIICNALLWGFLKTPQLKAAQTSRPQRLPGWIQVVLWTYLCAAAFLIGAYPFLLMGLESAQGFLALIQNEIQLRGLISGILVAAGSALVASILADLIAEAILGAVPHTWGRVALWLASCGLGGSLAVALTILALFQQPGFIAWRETPLPVVLGLMIWLLPRALVLQGIHRTLHSPIAMHAASLLASAPDAKRRMAAKHLHWLIAGRNRFASRVLLFHWAYWDLTLPHLLNPTGLTSAPVRLYGDAHFARNAVLTAKAGITMLAPVLMLLLAWGLIRLWERTMPHWKKS